MTYGKQVDRIISDIHAMYGRLLKRDGQDAEAALALVAGELLMAQKEIAVLTKDLDATRRKANRELQYTATLKRTINVQQKLIDVLRSNIKFKRLQTNACLREDLLVAQEEIKGLHQRNEGMTAALLQLLLNLERKRGKDTCASFAWYYISSIIAEYKE